MSLRNKEGYGKFIHSYTSHVYVVCPQCAGSALVKGQALYQALRESDVKVTCSNCGFNKKLGKIPSVILHSRQSKIPKGKYLVLGASVDPYFKLPLWLQESVNGNNFWAYNYEHLDIIKKLVEAKLRERNTVENFNGSLASRLPRWVTSKSNRETVLKVIERLKEK